MTINLKDLVKRTESAYPRWVDGIGLMGENLQIGFVGRNRRKSGLEGIFGLEPSGRNFSGNGTGRQHIEFRHQHFPG